MSHPSSIRNRHRDDVGMRSSVAVVVEFIGFAINSILYQRAVYPPDSFALVHRYGLPMMVTNDPELKSYLGRQLAQVANWCFTCHVDRIVLAILRDDGSAEPLERWCFNVDSSAALQKLKDGGGAGGVRPEEDLRPELQAIMHQIASSISYLPPLDGPLSFDLLVYTTTDCDIPNSWEVSDGRLLLSAGNASAATGAECAATTAEVRLRAFFTNYHRVEVAVTFRDVAAVEPADRANDAQRP